MSDVPDLAEIEAIAMDTQSGADEVNNRITQAYHQLSEAVRGEMDAGENLDWCGFAKWSSHTVGVRFNPNLVPHQVELMAQHVQGYLPGLELFHPLIVGLLEDVANVADGLVIKALRGGNASIFLEMGSVFAHLLRRWPESRLPDTASNRDFAATVVADVMDSPSQFLLQPLSQSNLGRPVPDSLLRGIDFYLRAAREPAHRAELMLAGSMLFSTYEQERANRLISIGICAPIRARLLPLVQLLTDDDVQNTRFVLDGPGNGPFADIETQLVRKITDIALTVVIAGTRVRLGHPESLPAPLVTPTLPETTAVMAKVAQDASGLVPNWVDLRYRLGFIGRYFAVHQRNPAATGQPPPYA